MRLFNKVTISIVCIILIFSGKYAVSDTITMKDNRVIKGVIVEDYHDRVVVSTYKGEIFLKKEDIMGLVYDSEVQNLTRLAEMALEKGKYDVAYGYYDKAYAIDPNSKKVKDGRIYIHTLLFKKSLSKKKAQIKRYDEFEERRTLGVGQIDTKSNEKRLKKELGLVIRKGGIDPQIIKVLPASAAYRAGVEEGDFIVAIWGRLTGYMNIKQILNLLLEKGPRERKVTLERVIKVKILKTRGFLPNLNKLIGASFAMQLDGLTVSSVREGGSSALAGLKKGDLIMAIDGNQMRYLPIQIAKEMIHTTKRDYTKLTIRRELSIWEI